ncbi:hypothetical protein Tco_0058626 [Tanacetum coccineum]
MEETSRITLNERCSANLLNEIPLKEKDLGSFTIPCIIGNVNINKSLADLGANQYIDSGVFSNQNNEEPTSQPTLFTANTKEPEKQISKLKELPFNLEYAFLDNNHEFSVIISSSLSGQEKELLLQVLSKHKASLAWKFVDIKGINPSFCDGRQFQTCSSTPT